MPSIWEERAEGTKKYRCSSDTKRGTRCEHWAHQLSDRGPVCYQHRPADHCYVNIGTTLRNLTKQRFPVNFAELTVQDVRARARKLLGGDVEFTVTGWAISRTIA